MAALGPAQRARRVFINCPFDDKFEDLFLAYIAGLAGLGLTPVTVLDLPSDGRTRLERLLELLSSCQSSIHDLSRVELSGKRSPVPRFNMPFELGMAVGQRAWTKSDYRFFLFEKTQHRLQRSLSDISGVDSHAHQGTPSGVLRQLGDAFPRKGVFAQPTTRELETVYRALRKPTAIFKQQNHTSSVFATHLVRKAVLAAHTIAEELDAAAR